MPITRRNQDRSLSSRCLHYKAYVSSGSRKVISTSEYRQVAYRPHGVLVILITFRSSCSSILYKVRPYRRKIEIHKALNEICGPLISPLFSTLPRLLIMLSPFRAIRRLVTGNTKNGKSTFVLDDSVPSQAWRTVTDKRFTRLWVTEQLPADNNTLR